MKEIINKFIEDIKEPILVELEKFEDWIYRERERLIEDQLKASLGLDITTDEVYTAMNELLGEVNGEINKIIDKLGG